MKQLSTATVIGLKAVAGILGAALMLGCGGPVTGEPGTSSSSSGGTVTPPSGMTGQSVFEMTLYPALQSGGCAGCHASGVAGAPVYMANDAAGSYAKIKMSGTIYKQPPTSTLLTIGTGSSKHSGGPISESIRSAATQWLNAEFSIPTTPGGGGTGGGNKPPTQVPTGTTGGANAYNDLVEAFGQCMNRGDWNQLMAQFPLIPTDDFGTCSSCHGEGNAGTFLNADPNITYDSIRDIPFVYRLVQPRFDNGQLTGIDASTRLIDKGQLPSNQICFDVNKVVCHSTYNIPNDQQADLQAFQLKTLNKIKNGMCSLPEP